MAKLLRAIGNLSPERLLSGAKHTCPHYRAYNGQDQNYVNLKPYVLTSYKTPHNGGCDHDAQYRADCTRDYCDDVRGLHGHAPYVLQLYSNLTTTFQAEEHDG